MERLLVAVEVPHERDQAALEIEGALTIRPLVDEPDPDALRQVGGFPEALRDRVERVVRRLEHLGIGTELRRRAATPVLRAQLADGRGRLAAHVLLRPHRAVARRLDAEPLRQRVDDAHADAVQPAGNLVAAPAELAAGVEHRVHDLHRVLAGGVAPDGHPTAIVGDDHRGVGLDHDLDMAGMAGHRLVDRVIDHLPDEVMQPAHIG